MQQWFSPLARSLMNDRCRRLKTNMDFEVGGGRGGNPGGDHYSEPDLNQSMVVVVKGGGGGLSIGWICNARHRANSMDSGWTRGT
ncbi:hypothetical protein Tco_0185332 [Tanacetum coccineum]